MEWTILDFNFPDKLPFSFLKKRFGDQAEIFLSYVSIPLDELPEKIDGMTTAYDNRPELLGYTERAVTKVLLTDETVASMRRFAEKASKYGVYQVYQPVLPTPTVPAEYRICLPQVCAARSGTVSLMMTATAPRNQRGPANLQSFTRSFSIFVKEEEHESCDVSGPSARGYSPADPG